MMFAHHEAVVVAQAVSVLGVSGLSVRCLWKLAVLRLTPDR